MRKFLIVLASAGVSMCSVARDADPTLKHSIATSSFWSNWLIQAGGEWNAWYSSEEHGSGLDRSPFKGFCSSPTASITIDKWFAPGLGPRTKLQGVQGKTVYADKAGKPVGDDNKYWILNEHALFNLSSMLCGYNPNRVWNFIPFAGAGSGRTVTYNSYAMDLSVGILNTFCLGRHVALHLEAGWNRSETDIDGGTEKSIGNRGRDSHDNNFYGELGLTFSLGKALRDRVPDVDAIKALSQSQINALNAQFNDANAENARLKDMLANQEPAETPATVKEFVATPVSIFFSTNKTNIASQKDLVNVQAVAKYVKENNSRLMVNGYADSATGKPEYNQWLSEERAKTVANELVKMGVSRDNTSTRGNGGVDELSPISFNRRVTVQVSE